MGYFIGTIEDVGNYFDNKIDPMSIIINGDGSLSNIWPDVFLFLCGLLEFIKFSGMSRND